jgi:outer membrane protein TolC
MMIVVRTIFFLLISTTIFSQNPLTQEVFTLDSFLQIVRQNHPVMRQAALLDGKADAAMLESRGAFDPKLYGDYEDKSFDQKNYFRKGEGGLKIPTWIGADVKLAYAWTNGIFLNNEANLPQGGQAIAGIEVPLAQGLFFDQRRAQIQMAKLIRESNEAERRIIINDLLMEATEAYWEWAFQYQTVRIYSEGLDLAQNRFEMVRESFVQGDKPAIDTLESLIQIQNRELLLNQAQTDFENSGQNLSNYLWNKNMIPLEITPVFIPEALESDWVISNAERVNLMNNNWMAGHPDLRSIQVKQRQLEVKEKLKREGLKPRVNVNYNLLADGFNFGSNKSEDQSFQSVFRENYKWGVELNYPIFLRKARGGLDMIRLEQLETEYKFQEKQLNIQNKVQIVLQQLDMIGEQVITQANILQNYQRLLEAENLKFQIGESSIFMLNSREQKLIETNLKLVKLQKEYQKLRRKLDWVRGQFD